MIRDRAILTARRPAARGGVTLTFLTRRSGKARLFHRPPPKRARQEFFDPLRGGELLFTAPTERAPGRLVAFDCEEIWPALRRDLERLVSALHMAEGATLVAGENEPAPEIYDLLLSFLDLLALGGDPTDLRIFFDIRLLALAGFSPSLERCVACGAFCGGREVRFALRGGGVICGGCDRGDSGPVQRLSRGAVSTLVAAAGMPAERVSRLRLASDTREEAGALVDAILETVLEGPPATTVFLRRLQREGRF